MCVNPIKNFGQGQGVILFLLRFHYHVIYIHFYGVSNEVFENLIDQSLISSSCIFEVERRHLVTLILPFCHESWFALIEGYICIWLYLEYASKKLKSS